MYCPPGKVYDATTTRCVHARSPEGRAALARRAANTAARRAKARGNMTVVQRAAAAAVKRAAALVERHSKRNSNRRMDGKNSNSNSNNNSNSNSNSNNDDDGDPTMRQRKAVVQRMRAYFAWTKRHPDPSDSEWKDATRTIFGYFGWSHSSGSWGWSTWAYRIHLTPTLSYRVVATSMENYIIVFKVGIDGEGEPLLTIDQESFPRFIAEPGASIEDLAFWQAAGLRRAVHDKKGAAQYPKRAEATKKATSWTSSDGYRGVCDAMRGVTPLSPRVAPLIKALTSRMKHAALVAPAMPRAASRIAPKVLWRGVHGQPHPRVGVTTPSNGGCFTAFSYDESIAGGFAMGGADGFLLRLQIDRIARGTPWIWMMATGSRDRNFVKSYMDEGEVLLPPGYLKILSRHVSGGLPVYDVAFVPRAEFLRRGALPRPTPDGQLVTRTVGGHRLEVRHPALRANVAARRTTQAKPATASPPPPRRVQPPRAAKR